MKKKTLLWISLIVIVAIGSYFVWNAQNKKTAQDKEIVKIGAILPLTGTYGAYGVYMKQGMELALQNAVRERIISEGEVELVFEDSQADPQKAVSAFKKLISMDNIIACIPATSGVTLAMKPIANQSKIILINATAISNDIEDESDYMYSIIPNAELEGSFLAEYAYNKLNKRNVAIIYRNDASGKSFQESISKKFTTLGGTVIYQEAHQPKEESFSLIINKLNNLKSIDAVFVMSFGPEVANFVKQAKELNLNKQIFTYETFLSPTSLEIAKNAAEGVIFCSPDFDENSEDPKIKKIKQDIYNSYNGQTEFNYFIAAHYDAIGLLIQAISKGNKTPEQIKSYFDTLSAFDGITGEIKFHKNGSADVPLTMYQVINNKFVKIQ